METTNHECYVSLEVAKLLKDSGFDWECVKNYMGEIHLLWTATTPGNLNDNSEVHKGWKSAPTLDVAQRWLREVKSFEIFVGFTKHDFGNGNEKAYFYDCYEIPENEDAFEHFEDIYYHSYEEALEAGIKKALEIILEK